MKTHLRAKVGGGFARAVVYCSLLFLCTALCAGPLLAQVSSEPVVAIHVSELTAALETTPAVPPTPTGPGTSGYQWWYAEWRYAAGYESLKEALRSDGTPFVEVSDADIVDGRLLLPDGTPRYPILISLWAEAVGDYELSPLRDYVYAGGFLLVGSSSLTRNPDGTTRRDFALSPEMGLHMASPNLSNWALNRHFTKGVDHRIVSHIPAGTINWRAPAGSEEIPWGVSPDHMVHGPHYVWQVTSADATVIARCDSGPLVAVKNYGKGQFIYHGTAMPLIGHGGYDPGMYAYMIFRRSIDWAFENSSLPMMRLSPWRYPYNAALMVRHDFENSISLIKSIQSSAQFEKSRGAKGDYYFSTGALRQYTGSDRASILSGIKSAVSNYGATIGSHNGGLRNPVNPALGPNDYDYWHWGPDEVLDEAVPGYASGAAYASASISSSYQDIEGWLRGLDNGRAGCGSKGNCPRTWVSPYFNSTREASIAMLDKLSVKTVGERKLGPFPHWTVSYQTPASRLRHVTLPASDWYVGSEIAQSTEYHTRASIREAVDFYYNLGGLINFYGHAAANNGGVEQDYVTYGVSKPRIWATNAVGVYDWWVLRSPVRLVTTAERSGNARVLRATVSGAADAETAVDLSIPQNELETMGDLRVYLNGSLAAASEYRTTTSSLRIRVGSSVSRVEVDYTVGTGDLAPTAANDSYSTSADTDISQAAPGVLANDSDPEGTPLTAQLVLGPSHGSLVLDSDGSFVYSPAAGYVGSDSFTYTASDGNSSSNTATASLMISSAGGLLLLDDFTRSPGPAPEPFNWVIPSMPAAYANRGVFDTVGGTLNCGTDVPNNYGLSYSSAPFIDNHSVEADIRFAKTGTFGGGIFGRLDASTGARYGAWIYPEGSAGIPAGYGPAVIKLVKTYDWGSWSAPLGMRTISIPAVGAGWHHLKLAFSDNRIRVYYDSSAPLIDMVDDNAGGYAPYSRGYTGVDYYAYDNTYGPSYNNFTIRDSAGSVVFNDDFGQEVSDPLSPWTRILGSWSVSDGALHGSSSSSSYGYVNAGDASWTNYTVEGTLRFPSGAFGGGIGGRVDPASGSHYGAWIYPDGSDGGSNTLKLCKLRGWTTWSGVPMQQVSLPSVGTGPHRLKLEFNGNRIKVYYDGSLKIDVTDNNFDSRAAYLQGAVGVGLWTYNTPFTMEVDDVAVRTLN